MSFHHRILFVVTVLAIALLGLNLSGFNSSFAAAFSYTDSWGKAGFNLVASDASGVEVVYSVSNFAIEDVLIDGQTMQAVYLPGVVIPNAAGAPNLPGSGRYIALPQSARASVRLLDYRTEVYQNIDLVPAAPIPLETDDSPPVYKKDMSIYSHNAYYPESPVRISEVTDIRGVDVVVLGITPFQYNPVTKELVVYRDLRVHLDFIGGRGHFGEDRLRSRYWEPILEGNILNYSSLPEIDFNRIPHNNSEVEDVEYLIIVPNDPVFIAWADTIKAWRTKQGIITGVATLNEMGGNNATTIEAYINNAYNNWDIPPVAILLLSDYQSTGDVYGITTNFYSGAASDNIYADINANQLPDLAIARITAQNNTHLSTMVNKFLNYEQNPPTDPSFYSEPLMAGGWQTDRWFILCSEVCYGYFSNELGKRPERQYALITGFTPTSWSSNQNTYMIVNYFGPSGTGYIPTTPSYLNNWTGNATGINSVINSGAFLVLHRDHGAENGWGTPSYTTSNITGLTNTMLPFVFSINCLTGKYNWGSTCFVEGMHRMNYGALGMIGASETSYSFVNDTYCWGMWDSMWPDFDPGYGTDETGLNNLRPCFANVYGKYYLSVSNWPYNTGNKVITYHLFHHHGDPFITMYSEVPQNLEITFNSTIMAGTNSFTFTAEDGAIVALTVNDEIIGVAEGTGAPVVMDIEPQTPGSPVLLTATLFNHYRYTQNLTVVAPSGAYVIFNDVDINDPAGNNNGLLNSGETAYLTITVENVGNMLADDVIATLTTTDTYTTILDNNAFYGDILPGSTAVVNDGYQISILSTTPCLHEIPFTLTATDGDSVWVSGFNLTAIPNLDLEMTPTVTPVIVPANGGSFTYTLSLQNIGAVSATFDAWIDILYPSGSIQPVAARSGVTLVSGASISRLLTQTIPGTAPAGEYEERGHVGINPTEVWEEDSFPFTKLAGTFNGFSPYTDWTLSGLEGEGSPVIPTEFTLSQNYPNPFNPITNIDFTVPQTCNVRLSVYNLLGDYVTTIYEGLTPAGYYSVNWNASNIASGVYFYHLQAGNINLIQKCVLMK